MTQEETTELLDWTYKQGRILTCNGKATMFYSPERGFPFEKDELPHYHLMANTFDDTFLPCPAKNKALQNPICGAFFRPIFVGGFEHSTDHDESVYNVQTNTLFIDLRIPRLGQKLFQHVKGFDSMTCEELKMYARRHVFAGYTRVSLQEQDERPVCTRYHCMDWNFVGVPRPRPNKWYVEMSPCGDVWKELAYAKDNFHQHYYWERWERLKRDGRGHGLVLALKREKYIDQERDGVIVVVGDHFSYMYGRMLIGDKKDYSQKTSLVDLVDAALDAGDRSTAECYLSIDAGHGMISTGWTIDCAIQPWKENTKLFDIGAVAIDGSDIDSCELSIDGAVWKVVESSVGITELKTVFQMVEKEFYPEMNVDHILLGSTGRKRDYETALIK
jgi:hypothetical protein